MSHMPYWLAKTPEMIAMDRWFSIGDAVTEVELVARYQDAIARVTAPNAGGDVLTGNAASLGPIRGGAAAAEESFEHFGSDWLNPTNLNSGGDFWPQIPSWQIIIWLRQGVLTAAKKALGVNPLGIHISDSEETSLFHAEIDTDPLDPRDTVLPLVTIWVCTGNTSSAGFEVDAVRGPTVVELVIATPPPRMRSRVWEDVRTQVDQFWTVVHQGMTPPEPPPNNPPQS